MKSNVKWTSKVLVFVNAFPAAINVLLTFIILDKYGAALAGAWFFLRSFCQLTLSLNPGVNLGFLMMPGDMKSREDLIFSNLFTICWYSFLAVFCFSFIFSQEIVAEIKGASIFFWSSLFLYNFSAIFPRSDRAAGVLVYATSLDFVFSSIILVAILFTNITIGYAIALISFKFLLKSFFGLRHYILSRDGHTADNTDIFTLSRFWRLISVGFGLSLKSFVQVVVQYGDKFLFGLFLTLSQVGIIGLISAATSPIFIIMSSIYAWYLPLIYEKNIKSQIFEKVRFVSVLVFLAPWMVSLCLWWFNDDQGFFFYFLFATFISLVGYFNFVTSFLFRDLGTISVSVMNLVVILSCYLAIYSFSAESFYFGVSMAALLLALISCLIVYFLFGRSTLRWLAMLMINPLAYLVI